MKKNLIEVSIGEIVDKLTILRIKCSRIHAPEQLYNVIAEHDYLEEVVFQRLGIDPADFNLLLEINTLLWDIEDRLRVFEREGSFDEAFVESARSVYKTNDKRAAIKHALNIKYGSSFVEEKSYENYKDDTI